MATDFFRFSEMYHSEPFVWGFVLKFKLFAKNSPADNIQYKREEIKNGLKEDYCGIFFPLIHIFPKLYQDFKTSLSFLHTLFVTLSA